jgi:hypothetical protein
MLNLALKEKKNSLSQFVLFETYHEVLSRHRYQLHACSTKRK